MEINSIPSIEDLKQRLTNEVVNIAFIKRDGSLRHMEATLKKDMQAHIMDIRNAEVEHPHGYFIVTDVELDEWRAFWYDSLITVE